MLHNAFRIFAIMFFAFYLVLIIACQSGQPYQEIQFSNRIPIEKLNKRQSTVDSPFVIVIASIVSPKESFNNYEKLAAYVESRLGLSVQIIYTQNYKEALDLFQSNKADLGFVCSALYVIGKKKNIMEMLVVPLIRGKSFYQAYIIVPISSNANNFNDLAGSKFAFTDEFSLTGYFYPLFRAKNNHKMWKQTVFSGSHDNSIQIVNASLVDGASIDGLIYEELFSRFPGKVKNIKIIEKSEDFGIPPVVVSHLAPKNTCSKLRKIFIDMRTESDGQKILGLLGIERYDFPDERNYHSIEKLLPEASGK